MTALTPAIRVEQIGLSTLYAGDCRAILPTLPAASVQCCVTSPPYFGLRDYGVAGQIGLEPSPDAYVAEMVAVFREVRRVLAESGVVFLNLGDSYSRREGAGGDSSFQRTNNKGTVGVQRRPIPHGYKDKDLLMIPARVALALQADGWWLRSQIVWAKPNPMPESCRDRCTSSYEMVYHLSKRANYYYDAEAIAEPAEAEGRIPGGNRKVDSSRNDADRDMTIPVGATRNRRNVWEIATAPFPGSHFAVMPPALAEICIKAGSRPGDTVLDPFAGAGTTLLTADRLGRTAIGIELNPDYAALARNRVVDDAPLFAAAPIPDLDAAYQRNLFDEAAHD